MTGFFGKLPARGDFLARGLPRPFLDAWDDWLQAGMADSRQALGDGWLQAYLTSPLWRFALSPGAVDESAWSGVFMPSVDKVGRYFPMTIAMQLPVDTNPYIVAACNDSLFTSIENLLLAALDDEQLDVESFAGQLQELPAPVVRSSAVLTPLAPEQGMSVAVDGDAGVGGTLLGLSAASPDPGLMPCCLWWGSGSELIAPTVALSRGLPKDGRFSALIDGDWSGHGWAVNGKTIGGVTPTVVDVAEL